MALKPWISFNILIPYCNQIYFFLTSARCYFLFLCSCMFKIVALTNSLACCDVCAHLPSCLINLKKNTSFCVLINWCVCMAVGICVKNNKRSIVLCYLLLAKIYTVKMPKSPPQSLRLLCIKRMMYEDGTKPAVHKTADCYLLICGFILISWHVSV